MATQKYWRCLSSLRAPPTRLPTPTYISGTSSAAFSTTASLEKAGTPAGRKLVGGAQKGKKTLRLGGGKRGEPTKGKAPAPGERKAIRKRIVLSNTNAFEVPGIQDWSADNLAEDSSLSTIVALPGTTVDSLRAIEAFKSTQGWGFFARPTTLVKAETLELARHIKNTNGKTLRKLVVGERGTGKSVLALQAQTMAFLNGWVVIHIPEAQDLTIAHTSYAPIEGSNPTKYTQKTYTAELLGRIAKANEAVLSKLELSMEHTNLPISVQSNMSLSRFAELGARDPDIAWPIYQALWKELTSTTAKQTRPPVLFTVDGLSHMSRLSEYLAPSMHYIHAHDLALVDHFVSFLSGASTLPNGGLILGVDSNSNRPPSPSLDLAIAQSEIRAQTGRTDMPMYDEKSPYERIDERVLSTMRNVDLMKIKGLSRPEARTLLEYYARSGMLRANISDGFVTERWTLAGGGIVGELERASVKRYN